MAYYRSTPEVVYDYVEDLDANLVCAICQSALIDPVTTTSCKHTFCRDCIHQAIAVNPQCPIDRSALTKHSLRETEQLVKLMLDELKVRCGADGCGAVMQRGLLLAHLRTCPMTIVMCEDADCGLKMSKQKVSKHRAYECFQRKMECEKCGVLLTFRDQTTQHRKRCISGDSQPAGGIACPMCNETYEPNRSLHQWSCSAARVPCTHTARGCPAIIPRSALASHLETCPFEAMSAFFVANDARFEEMEEKQRLLTAELEHMRAAVGATSLLGDYASRSAAVLMQSEGEEEALGRTEREETNNAATMLEPEVSPGSPQAPLASPTARPPHAEPPAPAASTSPHASPRALRRDMRSGMTERAAADIAASRSLFSPSFGSRQSYADRAFNHLSDPVPTTLAALEGAVTRLRRVVVQLASGLDTMERRNEVRTMTESLRILEEVGALRAIVNSIRLQVMIDRPGTPGRRRSSGLTPGTSTLDIPTTTSSTAPFSGISTPVHGETDSTEVTSMYESVVFSAQGNDASSSSSMRVGLSANSRAHAWALGDISRRRAGRDATAIGGPGGIVGEPMGIPRGPDEREDPVPQMARSRSSSRLSQAVSNGFQSIRSVRRGHGNGPRL